MAYELLNPKDSATVREVMNRTYDILRDKRLYIRSTRSYSTDAFSNGTKKLDLIGASPICSPVSDAVTRAAQSMGIAASREMHALNKDTIASHYVTSFGPLDEMPSDNDPILCATWGQFHSSKFLKRLGKKDDLYGFFPKRSEVKKLLPSQDCYDRNYGVGSVALRQTTHASLAPQDEAVDSNPGNYYGHLWLNTTPDDILTGQYPVGEVAVSDFSVEAWELKGLAASAAKSTATNAGTHILEGDV